MVTVPRPALATPGRDRLWRDGWVHERKLDGQRCLVVREGDETCLFTRSGREVTNGFPEIAEVIARQTPPGFVLDGELVAFEGTRTSFPRLQPRLQILDPERARSADVEVFLYVFDLLEAEGEDLRRRPLVERKRRLRALLDWQDPVRFLPHRTQADDEWFQKVCCEGWEGVVAKRADAPYPVGRTTQWLKYKCDAGQELVVVGWTDPLGARPGLGALLLAYHDRSGGTDDLVYAGKVGAGLSHRVLADLHQQLAGLEVEESPCTRGTLPAGVHWTRPELVAQVAFSDWTTAGQLRHPRFLGLRTDKPASEVVREAR